MERHFLREAVQKHEINIIHVPTQKMAADIFTIGLCEAKFTEHRGYNMGRLNPNPGRV